MFLRTLSLGAVVAGLLVLPLACGSFDSSSDPAADGGDAGGPLGDGGNNEGGPAVEGGGPEGGPAPDGTTPDQVKVLASGYGQLRAIAASETDVVFIDQGSGGVHSVPITGGTVLDLSKGGGPTSVALANGTVYWTNVNDTDGSFVASIAVNGSGAPTMTATTGTMPDQLLSVVAASSAGVFAMSANNGLMSDAIQQFDPSLAPKNGAVIPNLPNPFALAAFGTMIYWTEGTGAVASATVGSPVRTVIASGEDGEHLAADAAGVYWTVPSKGEVHGKLSGPPITLASNEASPRSIAGDGTYVYWQNEKGELRRSGHTANGTSSLFTSGFMPVTDMHARGTAVTSQYVVWLTGDGQVLRLHK